MFGLEGKYDIIYCDPPWSYRFTGMYDPGTGRVTSRADMHYPTMSFAELGELPVLELAADDCLLFLWSSGAVLDDMIQLGKKWGFQYVTVGFVWYKQRKNTGHYTMSECEMVLIFKHGRIPKPRGARNVRQFLSQKHAGHSQKPSEIRERITQMFPSQRKLEMFARERADGWDAFGNELETQRR